MTMTISEFTATELQRMKPACAGKIFGVPLAGPGRARATPPLRPGAFHYAAAPNRHKGHLTLLKAALGLAGRGLDYRLTLTGAGWNGTGEVVGKARHFVEEHRALLDGRVIMAGDVQPGEARRFFEEASCVVLPSSYEGFGLPLVEALSLGKPVICADIAPFREQIALYACEDLADFVPGGDAAALEEAMSAHLAAPPRLIAQPELESRLNRWTWADAARKTKSLLEQLHG